MREGVKGERDVRGSETGTRCERGRDGIEMREGARRERDVRGSEKGTRCERGRDGNGMCERVRRERDEGGGETGTNKQNKQTSNNNNAHKHIHAKRIHPKKIICVHAKKNKRTSKIPKQATTTTRTNTYTPNAYKKSRMYTNTHTPKAYTQKKTT